jgi:hypothetical protein
MHFKIMLSLLVWLPSQMASAGWDLSLLRTLGEECAVESTEVEDSKLTVRFSRFTAELLEAATEHNSPAAQCSVVVGFKVPSGHRLDILTHRAFAYVTKNADSRVSLRANIAVNNQFFYLGGMLPEGSVLDQKVLLYKSFSVGESFPSCSSSETRVDVTLHWQLVTEATAVGGRAKLALAGEDLWTDAWIETKSCEESTHTLAL